MGLGGPLQARTPSPSLIDPLFPSLSLSHGHRSCREVISLDFSCSSEMDSDIRERLCPGDRAEGCRLGRVREVPVLQGRAPSVALVRWLSLPPWPHLAPVLCSCPTTLVRISVRKGLRLSVCLCVCRFPLTSTVSPCVYFLPSLAAGCFHPGCFCFWPSPVSWTI